MNAVTLSHFPSAWISGIGLLLFLSVFIGTLFWVFRKSSGEFYQRIADLPFTDQVGLNENTERKSP